MQLLIASILLVLTFNINAQDKSGNVWILGFTSDPGDKLVKLDFLEDTIKVESFEATHSMADPSITTISDTDGNLLLYSNGCQIFDRNNQVIEGGESIGIDFDVFGNCRIGFYGNSLGTLLAPQPCNNDIVHLIYLDQVSENHSFFSRRLLTTIIDVSDPDAPFVIEKHRVINESTYDVGAVGMTQHANGLDWWICLLQLNTNCYDCVQLSESGFSEPVTSCTGPVWGFPDQPSLGEGVGTFAFSPDGSAYVRFNHGFGLSVYEFDNNTGSMILKEQICRKDSGELLGIAGVSISPNSQYLYVSALDTLYQYDLFADSITETAQVVGILDLTVPNTTVFRYSSLAPDGKLYIAGVSSRNGLHVVHEPNRKGLDCNVEQLGFLFPENVRHFSGIPNNPWYGKLPNESLCDSLVSVQEIDLYTQVDVFPNPASSRLTISSPELGIQRVDILDVQGQTQTQHYDNSREIQYDLQGYVSGLYFFSVDTEKGQVVKKVVVE